MCFLWLQTLMSVRCFSIWQFCCAVAVCSLASADTCLNTERDVPDLPIVDEKHRRVRISQAEWIQNNRFILAAYGPDLRLIDPVVRP